MPPEMEPLVTQPAQDPAPSSVPAIEVSSSFHDEEDTMLTSTITTSEDVWRKRLLQGQQVALIVAPLLALVAQMTVGVWIYHLGGLSRAQGQAKLAFNWHPLFMIMAFVFMTVASLSFRYPTMMRLERTKAKWVHGTCWIVAALCMILGLVAVFHSHNDPVSGLIANLYSLHSWIGLSVVLFYFGQLLAGMSSFVPGIADRLGIPPTIKARILQVHLFLGPLLYKGVLLTILLGIQEKEGFVGCAYKVDKPDTRPWTHYHDIPEACRISHGLGLLVLLVGLTTCFAMHSFDRGDFRSN